MPKRRSVQSVSETGGIFKDLDILVFPAHIAAKRLTLYETQIRKEGGQWLTVREVKAGHHPSYIIVDELLAKEYTKVRKLFEESHIDFPSVEMIVTTKWLSSCLKSGALEPKDNYILSQGISRSSESCDYTSNVSPESGETIPVSNTVDSLTHSAEEANCSGTQCEALPKRAKLDTDSISTTLFKNDLIITELQKLADAFQSKGDTWRAHGYTKAISSIRRHGQPICNYEDAVKLPGIGARMAEKVWEILECGSLRKVAEVCGDEKTKILELFTGVWGAGPSTAESWYQQGYRSLEDLKENASLTKQQLVGLKHYDEFADRMSREEVENIGAVVKEVALVVEPAVEVILVGSYRRGKLACGDVDVLICRPDHIKPGHILPRLLELLKEKSFITDDLVHIEEQKNQRKYLGVCRLPGENRKHRRLDIFVAPRSELAPALMHYTGSALFNRTIRLAASKKGMSLSEHCLATNVMRQGTTIINDGQIVPTPTEHSIFEALGMEYLEPSERNH